VTERDGVDAARVSKVWCEPYVTSPATDRRRVAPSPVPFDGYGKKVSDEPGVLSRRRERESAI